MAEQAHRRAVRRAYDTVADDYAELLRDALAANRLDRAMLTAFAEFVRAGDAGPLADSGCGPGRIAAHLHTLGLSVFGVDRSPTMVEVAERTLPTSGPRWIDDLDLPDRTLGGVVAWYSIIHAPRNQLPAVFAQFHRLLAPGRPAAAGVPGRRRLRPPESGVRPRDLTRRPPAPADVVADLLDQSGFTVDADLTRHQIDPVPQAYLPTGGRPS